MRAIAQADGRRRPRYLLHRHGVREVAKPGAAFSGRNGEAEQSELAQLAPQVARKEVAAVDFVGARRDALLGEATHLIAHGIDHLAEAEIELAVGSTGHRLQTPIVSGPKIVG